LEEGNTVFERNSMQQCQSMMGSSPAPRTPSGISERPSLKENELSLKAVKGKKPLTEVCSIPHSYNMAPTIVPLIISGSRCLHLDSQASPFY
jgi:hypothetical protein